MPEIESQGATSPPDRATTLWRRIRFVRPAAFTRPGFPLPDGILRFVLLTSAPHQFALCALTVVVFLLELVPLELQRRIVNGLVERNELNLILVLGAAYAGMVLVHGGLKFALNVYRNWVGEQITRQLRRRVNAEIAATPEAKRAGESGVAVALIVAEIEPVGAFVGVSVSEPLLQAGILLTVLAYMVSLEPLLALVVFAVFSPQFVVVPLMQRAINRRVSARVKTLRVISTDVVAPPGRQDGRAVENGQLIEEVFALNMGVFRLKFGMNYFMNTAHHLSVIAALMLGGWFVLTGRTEVGTVVAFVSGIGRLNDPWGDLVNYFRDLTQIQMRYGLLSRAIRKL